MASTPVPEGVSLRFSATAVNGYASWLLGERNKWRDHFSSLKHACTLVQNKRVVKQ